MVRVGGSLPDFQGLAGWGDPCGASRLKEADARLEQYHDAAGRIYEEALPDQEKREVMRALLAGKVYRRVGGWLDEASKICHATCIARGA